MSDIERWPVVIVGSGPVGLTLANLLGLHGIRTLVLERNAGTVEEPRAIAIDAEGLRTMQGAGLYDAVAGDMLLGFDVDYLNRRGRPLFSMKLSQTPYGHAQQNSFDQPLLEKQLLAGLARFPHVEVRFRHSVEDFQHDAGGATIRGRDAVDQPFTVAADYLVGCDGGRSIVRQKLGIQMRGKSAPQRWLVVDTIDHHLADTLQCRFFCDPARPAMTLRKQHGKRRWEWMLKPGETDEQFMDDRTIRDLLAPVTRADEVVIERKCIYTFHSIVADRYRDGRVLIAGDAAHMMPPFAGQGMNSGLRDALNLSWKLPLLLRGLASDSLLDSYEKERRNHVIAATEIANRLGALIQPTSRVRAAVRDTVFFCLNLTRAGQRAFDRRLLGTLRVPSMRGGVFAPGADGAPSLAGQFVVQPQVRTAAGETVRLDEMLGPWFAVLGFGVEPRRALPAEALAAWEKLGARFVHVVPPGVSPSAGEVEDFTGTLREWFGDRSERIVAIRPDKFCAAQFGPDTATERTRDFIELLSPQEALHENSRSNPSPAGRGTRLRKVRLMQSREPGAVPLMRPQPIIKVDAVAHVMFEKPDLDLLERFLLDFGLVRQSRNENALYMRGTGSEPYVYVARRGAESRFVGIGFRAASRADLETLARATNTAIEQSNEPGGGERVSLRDPSGFRVDVIHGATPLEPLPMRAEPLPVNTPERKVRINETQRPTLRPSQVVRLGHVVLQATNFEAGAHWYMRHLGLIPTDVQCLADGAPNLAFMRLDRGDQPADHHSVVVFGGIDDAYCHSAYEVVDLDEVGMGQQVLRTGGWKHVWGIGRHILGSQIFDYWKDPFGDEMEHYADGDVFDAAYPTGYHSFDPSLLWMWGDDLPADFGPKLNLGALAGVAKRLVTGRLSMEKMRLLKQITAQPARPWLARR